jgi:hypothetical protein
MAVVHGVFVVQAREYRNLNSIVLAQTAFGIEIKHKAHSHVRSDE